jgi:hypothetical protein
MSEYAPSSSNARGAAVVIALLAMLLLTALGLILVLTTATETMIAAQFGSSQEAFYAADAGLQYAAEELATADWNGVLRGAGWSTFAVGSPWVPHLLSDGTVIDLAKATNLLNCGHASACTLAEMDASTADRPWGVNNPRWSLYAYGPLHAIVSTGTIDSAMYVAVWVSDDTSENDDDPTTDGADPLNPGSGVITIHAEAFGAGAAHKVLEATLGPSSDPSIGANQMIAWREIR